MLTVYLFSFFPVIIVAGLVWLDVRKLKRYGSRPKWIFVSILPVIAAAVIGFLYLSGQKEFEQQEIHGFLILALTLLFFSLAALEHSIHIQRIKKGHLTKDFKRRQIAFFILMIPVLVSSILSLLKLIKFDIIVLDLTAVLYVQSLFLVLGSLYIIYTLYNFVAGSLRKKNYPFIIFILTVFFIALVNLVRDPGVLFVLWTWTILIAYFVRLTGEYFYFKSYHLNLLLSNLDAVQHKRAMLLNKVIESDFKEDLGHIKDILTDTINEMEEGMVIKAYKISGMVLYRRSGDRYVVDSQDHIFGYCTPLYDLKTVKMLKSEVLINHTYEYIYDHKKIVSKSESELKHFGQKAVKKLIDTLKPVFIEPIPDVYKSLTSLIMLYPIINNDQLSGFMVVFKNAFNKMFPTELNTIQEFSVNLNTIYSLMKGKESQEERNRLQGEMNIAKEIQTSIVPKKVSIDGYEIACSMTTASEVGGDLYDFIANEYGNYLDIGDVSGHGLPAGVMALIHMASFQGAIEASSVLKKKINVAQLYDIVNKVLCRINRDRIGSDKFMTCNMFFEENGKLTHSGTHEIALIYRKKTDTVEENFACVDNTGFLGLSDLIDSKTSIGQFSLKKDDILVLYTDGAIEAKDESDVQFGIKKLKRLIKNYAEKSVDDINNAILDAVKSHAKNGDFKKYDGNFADDVTLFIFKKI